MNNAQKNNRVMKKNQIRLNESQLKSIITKSVKQILKEEFETHEYPEDVCEWGRKAQELGIELSRLCGKYRFEDNDLYEDLKQIESEYNSVCGDLNTLGIANHWES